MDPGSGLPPPPSPEMRGEEPSTPARSRASVVFTVVGIAAVLALVAGALVAMNRKDASDPARSGSTETPTFEDDFSTSSGGWPEADDRRATYGYEDEAFVVEVHRSGFTMFTATDIQAETDRIRVEGSGTLTPGSAPGAFGVACSTSEAENGFLFMLDPSSTQYYIAEMQGERVRWLAAGRDFQTALLSSSNATYRVTAECVADPSDARTSLRMLVDGTQVLSAIAETALRFIGPGLVVTAADGDTEALFDDVAVSPIDDEEASAIDAAAASTQSENPEPPAGSVRIAGSFGIGSTWFRDHGEHFRMGPLLGMYRIWIEAPDDSWYWAARWDDRAYASATAQLRTLDSRWETSGGDSGVACILQGEPIIGYVFAIEPEGASYEILRIEDTDRTVLITGTSHRILGDGYLNRIRGDCTVADGEISLRMSVNGQVVASTEDQTDAAGTIGIGMYAFRDHGTVDIRYVGVKMWGRG